VRSKSKYFLPLSQLTENIRFQMDITKIRLMSNVQIYSSCVISVHQIGEDDTINSENLQFRYMLESTPDLRTIQNPVLYRDSYAYCTSSLIFLDICGSGCQLTCWHPCRLCFSLSLLRNQNRFRCHRPVPLKAELMGQSG
jgi:hypothetical protein